MEPLEPEARKALVVAIVLTAIAMILFGPNPWDTSAGAAVVLGLVLGLFGLVAYLGALAAILRSDPRVWRRDSAWWRRTAPTLPEHTREDVEEFRHDTAPVIAARAGVVCAAGVGMGLATWSIAAALVIGVTTVFAVGRLLVVIWESEPLPG